MQKNYNLVKMYTDLGNPTLGDTKDNLFWHLVLILMMAPLSKHIYNKVQVPECAIPILS